MSDSFQLQRFVEAQDPVFQGVLEELRRGRKTSHWMWFIFPQIKGLGHSWMAQKYAISSRAEAEAYLSHPVLGPRLTECTSLVLRIGDRSMEEVFGGVDALKLRSSLTLFAEVGGGDSVFAQALQKHFDGEPDELTLRFLQQHPK